MILAFRVCDIKIFKRFKWHKIGDRQKRFTNGGPWPKSLENPAPCFAWARTTKSRSWICWGCSCHWKHSSKHKHEIDACCIRDTFHSILGQGFHQDCGAGVGVVRSRRFLGGVGVGFLKTLGVGVGFFCPTPDVQLDNLLHHTPKLGIPVEMVQFLLKL